jgi:hypothetical protein
VKNTVAKNRVFISIMICMAAEEEEEEEAEEEVGECMPAIFRAGKNLRQNHECTVRKTGI